jgi:hypothetical protein
VPLRDISLFAGVTSLDLRAQPQNRIDRVIDGRRLFIGAQFGSRDSRNLSLQSSKQSGEVLEIAHQLTMSHSSATPADQLLRSGYLTSIGVGDAKPGS